MWKVIQTERLILCYPANRSLEDMDAYFRTDPSVIVIKEQDAIMSKRPIKYIQHEEDALRNASIASKEGGLSPDGEKDISAADIVHDKQ